MKKVENPETEIQRLKNAVKYKTSLLKKKEWELKIEASLESVRASSMAMQHSNELEKVVKTLAIQLTELGLSLDGALILFFDKEKRDISLWIATYQLPAPIKVNIPYDWDMQSNLIIQDLWEAFESGKGFINNSYSGKIKNDYFKFTVKNNLSGIPEQVRKFQQEANSWTFSAVAGKNALLGIDSWHEKFISNQDYLVLEKFSRVFEQAYTRFLDLQKAEAQAREAQIEAALEKVRSRAMAMHISTELKEVAHELRIQIGTLGQKDLDTCVIHLNDESPDYINAWAAMRPPGSTEEIQNFATQVPKKGLLIIEEALSAYSTNRMDYVIINEGKKIEQWINFIREDSPGAFHLLMDSSKGVPIKKMRSYWSFADFEGGSLLTVTLEQPDKNTLALLRRFSNVFGLAYRRFADLKQAEAQTREAQIETALERVRSRSMAMQKSNELKDVIQLVFDQFVHLNILVEHAGFYIDYKERDDMNIWLADKQAIPFNVTLPYFDCATWNSFIDAKKTGKNFIVNYLPFEEKNKFYKDLFKFVPGVPEEAMEYCLSCPALAVSTVLLDNVGLYIENFAGIRYSDEENAVLMRFGKVFQQTYTRFLDLQKAEAQAREAQIEAALEKVRSRTLAMQKSEELPETSGIIFQQLRSLGIAPNRLYVCIIQNDEGNAEFWITDEDGSKVSMAYEDNLNHNFLFQKMYEGWKRKEKSMVLDIRGKELQDYLQYLSSIHVPFKSGPEQKRRWQYIAYFSKGFIGLASPDEQPAETLQLIERFAYVFNLTFTRFNDLKIAEVHALQAEQDLIQIKAARKKAEEALTELRAAQRQLIQSEKMASLGELTAGIAHEIQNPLNFVNNFSEVNKEMLEELKAERLKPNGERDESLQDELINDVFENSEKILHHGKRADGIIKGMLQHSRTSSGKKEPTDINALADEYLRLSFHGLRAKDKSFNAEMKTDFDKSIGKINIVPQDMGRVLLNLINNAFYAVYEKKKSADENYKPEVSVQTKKLDDKIEIKVSDNGNGIPEKIKDKIFQPFFTTKPTGEGTGLGLSLAYDIITKEHNGTIKCENGERNGTMFIIQFPLSS